MMLSMSGFPFISCPQGRGKNNGEKLITRAVSESLEYLKNRLLPPVVRIMGCTGWEFFCTFMQMPLAIRIFKGFYDEYNRVDLVEAVDKVPWKDRS